MSSDLVASVERGRAQLEASLSKLQTALRHWRTWDVEYEGLKEELGSLDDSANHDDIARIADHFGGELLTKKEIEEMTGLDKQDPREPQYIIRLIEKRQDYVQQNINTIAKQSETLNRQLEKLDEDLNPPEPPSDSILPISEVIEELDDEDNIISSKIQHPEEVTAKLVETLRQAGVTGLDISKPDGQASSALLPGKTGQSTVEKKSTATESVSSRQNLTTNQTSLGSPPLPSGTTASKVSSAPQQSPKASAGTAPMPSTQLNPDGHRQISQSLLAGSFRPGQRVIEIDDDDEIIATGAIIPPDESPEDAQLRREMLQYHLNEVGNVVAEMDILDGNSDDDFVDELEDMDGISVNSDLSEEEDEHGRSLGSVMTADYRNEMKDLEKRLKGRLMTNLGPEFPLEEPTDPDTTPEPARQDLPDRTVSKPRPASTKNNGTKSVRFAEELDVSPAPKKPRETGSTTVQNKVNPLSNTVPERSTTSTDTATTSSKSSRFKQSRVSASSSDTPPVLPPPGSRPILSNNVLERENQAQPTAPTDPEDDFDPEMQRRQLAARYYELRNKVIRQEGGFKTPEDEEDDGEGPLMEKGADGQVRKVSRFKAARMKH